MNHIIPGTQSRAPFSNHSTDELNVPYDFRATWGFKAQSKVPRPLLNLPCVHISPRVCIEWRSHLAGKNAAVCRYGLNDQNRTNHVCNLLTVSSTLSAATTCSDHVLSTECATFYSTETMPLVIPSKCPYFTWKKPVALRLLHQHPVARRPTW